MPRTIAVVDIGTSAVRLAVAEAREDGIRVLETLSQGLSLGRDTFAGGSLSASAVEEAVTVLRSYRRKLSEYGITDPADVRVVATNAVRESSNRLAFIDRVFVATGFAVEPIEDAEIHRITYRGVKTLLDTHPELREGNVLASEVGGGSTELLLFSGGNVAYSTSLRLGSLRLRQELRALRSNPARYFEVMSGQVRRTLEELADDLAETPPGTLLAMGGDMRFAARELLGDWDAETLARVPVAELEELARAILHKPVAEVVTHYKRTFPEAETLGPALLADVEQAKLFGLKEVLVTRVNLRDGLLRELAGGEPWDAGLREQVVRSAKALGNHYDVDLPHAERVAATASELFAQLRRQHRLDERYEVFLHTAALLHEAGRYIGTGSYHKHSMYVILHGELFGLSRAESQLVGLTARYHRRASPKATHPVYGVLDREGRTAVMVMASILRVAAALNAARDGRERRFSTTVADGRMTVWVRGFGDLAAEQLAVSRIGSLFKDTFGLSVALRSAS